MLTSFRVQNFKCWKDTGEIRLAPLTAFFGGNSSGKSSILQMLLILAQTSGYRDRTLVLNLGRGKEDWVNAGSFQQVLHHAYDPNPYERILTPEESRISWELGWKPTAALKKTLYSLVHSGKDDPEQELDVKHIVLAASISRDLIFGNQESIYGDVLLDQFQYKFEDKTTSAHYSVGVKRSDKLLEATGRKW